jgi:hypothetical protein
MAGMSRNPLWYKGISAQFIWNFGPGQNSPLCIGPCPGKNEIGIVGSAGLGTLWWVPGTGQGHRQFLMTTPYWKIRNKVNPLEYCFKNILLDIIAFKYYN